MVDVERVSVTFGGVRALNACSLTARSGTVTALIGPNGAGKTTLLDVISGALMPERGDVRLHGRRITHLNLAERAALGIRRTWQQVRLFTYLTVGEHLHLAAQQADATLAAILKGTPRPPAERYQAICRQFGIDQSLPTPVSRLSYGQRKLLQLAMAYIAPHRLLLLDEPVAGVNPITRERIELLLLTLKKQKHETLIVVEHDMAFVRKLADQVVALDEGAVLKSGSAEQVLADPRVVEAYLGV